MHPLLGRTVMMQLAIAMYLQEPDIKLHFPETLTNIVFSVVVED